MPAEHKSLHLLNLQYDRMMRDLNRRRFTGQIPSETYESRSEKLQRTMDKILAYFKLLRPVLGQWLAHRPKSQADLLPPLDGKLIRQALHTNRWQWFSILPLINQAQTQYARNRLADIQQELYELALESL